MNKRLTHRRRWVFLFRFLCKYVDLCGFAYYAKVALASDHKRSFMKGFFMSGQSSYQLKYKDFSKENSTVAFTGVQLDGDNYDAQLILAHDLRTATDAITLGARIEETVISERLASAAATPTDKSAQRERKWLVRYRDVTQYFDFPSTAFPNTGYGKTFTLDIPTADQSLLGAGNSDIINPTDAGIAAAITTWIAAFEAFQKSPYGGDVEVDQLVLVGRNL